MGEVEQADSCFSPNVQTLVLT